MRSFLTHLLYTFLDSCVRWFPARPQKGCLAVIRLDELGDYVLFRKALHLLHQHRAGAGFETVLLIGNSAWKNLFEAVDVPYVDSVFWIHKKQFQKSLGYRWKTLRQLRKAGVYTVVDTHYTPQRYLDISVLRALGAPETVGYANTTEPFTITVPTNHKPDQFELFRNLAFVQSWLGLSQPPEAGNNSIALPERTTTALEKQLPETFLALFPGSGRADKRWSPASFAQIADRCLKQFGLPTVLLGSPADAADARAVMDLTVPQMQDLTGQTTIMDTLYVLQKAAAVLSVDTGSVHLAAALDKPVVALYSGKHYGRFAPYPTAITPQFKALYAPAVLQLITQQDPRLFDEAAMPNSTIQDIAVETVWEALKATLLTAGFPEKPFPHPY